MAQISMTFGQMPDRNVFNAAFKAACPSGTYRISLNSADYQTMREALPACVHISACDSLDDDQTWLLVKALRDNWSEEWNEDSGSLAASIMETLGFEWI